MSCLFACQASDPAAVAPSVRALPQLLIKCVALLDWKGPIMLCMGSRASRNLPVPPDQADSDSAATSPSQQTEDPFIRFSNAVSLASPVGFLRRFDFQEI